MTSITLDNYADTVVGRWPTLLKMDIEGAEIEAITGASRMLNDPSGPDLLCEVGIPHLARFRHTPTELFERLGSFGYRAFNPSTGRPMTPADLSEHEYNVYFTKRA